MLDILNLNLISIFFSEPSSITFTVNSIIPEINGTYIESNEVLGLQENALCSLIDQGGVTSLCNPGLVHKRLELAGLTKNRMKKTDSEATMSIKGKVSYCKKIIGRFTTVGCGV